MRNGEFVGLPLELEQGIQTKGVDVAALEAQMDAWSGWKLSDLSLGKAKEPAALSRKYVRHYANDYPSEAFFVKRAEACFESHGTPVSMYFKTREDLARCVSAMYQLSYFHYTIGRQEAMKGSFPKFCCGISARNITVAAWDAGIVAATTVYCDSYDHAYVIVPFLVKKASMEGVLLSDPTSDQLTREHDKKIRNDIRILPRDGWKYVTDWAGGKNLYPELVQVSTCYGKDSHSYCKYMDAAFDNPVVVT